TYVPITDEITENECCDYIINPNFASAQLKRFNLDREMGWSQRANAGYAIFSVPEFESALKDFIDWKQRLGYNVKAFYDANWDSTKISNKITSLYWKDEARTEIDTDFNLSYLLFVGNDSLVPSGRVSYKWNKEEISDQFFLTDLPYGCMDGVGDLYPDIYRGRWPVYFESEVETIVDKVIRYEHRPPYDSDFYTSGTHFAFFEDGSKVGVNDGVEDGRFVKTSEDLFNYLTNNYDYTIDRIYTIDTTKTNNKDGLRYWPKEWSRYYSEGGDVPADMLYENGFNWQHTNHDLNKSINKGPSYLFVSGHGSENTWAWGTNRWYASYDVKWLKNRERIPVIFSISCLTGKFNDYRCLMRQFLSNPNGGAIGAFASSHVTYYNQFAALTQYFTNAIWPVPGIRLYENNRIQVNESAFESPHSIQQLGVILDHAVYNLPSVSYGTSNFTRNTFHCYGDPSLYFRTQEPITFDSSTEEVNRTAFGINAYLHDVEGFICFYDPTTGKSQRFYGTEASFVPEYSNVVKYIDVTVYTPNSVPYTDFGEFYPGYIGPDVSGTRLLGFRGNLDGSTATIDYYISMADKGKRLEILIVDMSTGNIISSWPLNEETTEFGQKCSVGIYCHSGLMTASLMVDGYPVSNIKVQIKL
ncbi:MAG: hypothetical protein K2O88_09525, partial [Paramuribaculum sp.]|nr:hypothetical protein [Paramuribaculum sp.]